MAPIRGSLLLLVFLALVPACSSKSGAVPTCATELRSSAPVTDRGSRKATGAVVTVVGANSAFTPTCITDVPRGTVVLSVRNTGKVLHNVQIAAQHVDVDVAPGHTIKVRVTIGSKPVVYVCKYHRDLGMVGILIPE
jgi:plastocyanin